MYQLLGVVIAAIVIGGAGYGFVKFVNHDEDTAVHKVNAQLIDCWEYEGFNPISPTALMGLKDYDPIKQQRYVGVFRLENGEEMTLRVPYSLEDTPRCESGILEYSKQEGFLKFSLESEDESGQI